MSAHAIVVERIEKRFGNHVAVASVSITVPRGCVYGILGPNGAGKSTTLRMINDIIAPDAGRIEILGKFPPGREAAARIGYLPEERGLYPKMRVLDMVRFIGELRGLAPRMAAERARHWLTKLGLAAWLDNRVNELSKGMQQKVQFATALIHEPELVILDEPWSGLDPINAEVLRATVDEVRAAGRTVLFSTHQMEQAEKICDAVAIIASGRVVLEGPLAEIKRAAAAGHLVALAFAQPEAEQAAAPFLADRAVVAQTRPARPGHANEILIELQADVAAQHLLRQLVAADIPLDKFEVVTPSLHQIFVERVGGAAAAVPERQERNI